MLLSTSTYFLFLAGVFLLYWPLSQRRAAALAVILFANYFFLARWHIAAVAVIPVASTIDYLIGQGLARATGTLSRRMLVAASIVLNVGLIVFLRYMPFLLASWAGATGGQAKAWPWVLPISVSFYAFQSLTYTIDLYRRDASPTSSYLAYLSAASFFPTVLSGPITRVSSLISQLEKRPALDNDAAGRAFFLIGLGLMKKLAIADYLASNLVNRVFDFPNLYSGTEVLLAVYAYAIQLYCDFSGYTDMAIGSALLLGIKLPANFNAPYSAANLTDFWRRWHISLSNWLRDYLYFSLPGARSKFLPYLNLTITMLIGGLWHGPSWNFAIWGALHGVGLAVLRLVQGSNKPGADSAPIRVLKIIATLHFVTFAWIFFRSPSFELASAILGRISSLSVSFANVSGGLWFVFAIAWVGHFVPAKWFDGSLRLAMRMPFYAQAAALAAVWIGLAKVSQSGAVPFIYNKF